MGHWGCVRNIYIGYAAGGVEYIVNHFNDVESHPAEPINIT